MVTYYPSFSSKQSGLIEWIDGRLLTHAPELLERPVVSYHFASSIQSSRQGYLVLGSPHHRDLIVLWSPRTVRSVGRGVGGTLEPWGHPIVIIGRP